MWPTGSTFKDMHVLWSCLNFRRYAADVCRRKKKAKQDAYLAGVSDRKLKGQLKHTEKLYKEANRTAARINQWLAPSDAGFVEAEGEQS